MGSYSKSEQLGRGPKRPSRIKANLREWDIIRERKMGPCRLASPICLGPIQLHHAVPRSWLGDDLPDNILPLCALHHSLITDNDSAAKAQLAEVLTDGEYAYVVDKLGEGALERLFGVMGAAVSEETP